MVQHLRHYAHDIQQCLKRGRQDEVNFDYILFRIDWLIHLLRYTSDDQNDGAITIHRVMNILRQVTV